MYHLSFTKTCQCFPLLLHVASAQFCLAKCHRSLLCLDCSQRILNKTRPHRGGVLHHCGLKWSNQIFARTRVVWVIGGLFLDIFWLQIVLWYIHVSIWMHNIYFLTLQGGGSAVTQRNSKKKVEFRIKSKYPPDHASGFPIFLKRSSKVCQQFFGMAKLCQFTQLLPNVSSYMWEIIYMSTLISCLPRFRTH